MCDRVCSHSCVFVSRYAACTSVGVCTHMSVCAACGSTCALVSAYTLCGVVHRPVFTRVLALLCVRENLLHVYAHVCTCKHVFVRQDRCSSRQAEGPPPGPAGPRTAFMQDNRKWLWVHMTACPPLHVPPGSPDVSSVGHSGKDLLKGATSQRPGRLVVASWEPLWMAAIYTPV